MPHKGHTGGSLGGGTEHSPARAYLRARRRKRQDEANAAKSGPVSTNYACICERNPGACRADEHPGRT